jgi:hypothetical protein
MLVFGAVAFKSCNDGGIEVIVDNHHNFIAANDIDELSNWIQFHRMNRNFKTTAGLPRDVMPNPNWAAQEGAAII